MRLVVRWEEADYECDCEHIIPVEAESPEFFMEEFEKKLKESRKTRSDSFSFCDRKWYRFDFRGRDRPTVYTLDEWFDLFSKM